MLSTFQHLAGGRAQKASDSGRGGGDPIGCSKTLGNPGEGGCKQSSEERGEKCLHLYLHHYPVRLDNSAATANGPLQSRRGVHRRLHRPR